MFDEDTDKDLIEDNISYALHLILKTKFKLEHDNLLFSELEKAELSLEYFLELWRGN